MFDKDESVPVGGDPLRIIAFLLTYPPHRRNGAFLTTQTFLDHLATRGHDVHVVVKSRLPVRRSGAVPVHPYAQTRSLMSPQTDVVLTHHGYLGGAPMHKQASRAKHLVMVHGEQSIPIPASADLMWFPSEACRQFYAHDGPSLVVAPPVFGETYRTEPGQEVALVGLTPNKGVAILDELARRLPHISFLGIASSYDRQVRFTQPNVRYLPNTADMRGIYARTRVLIMPSASESYGRVGIEAMYSGIPVVASPLPGIVEALGDSASYADPGDIDEWVRLVDRLTASKTAWRQASRAALRQVRALDPAAGVETFADALEALGRDSS